MHWCLLGRLFSTQTVSQFSVGGAIWLLILAVPAQAINLRVGLSQSSDQMTIGSSTTAELVDGTGTVIGQLPALQGFVGSAVAGGVSVTGKKAWQIEVRPQAGGMVYIRDRWYRGKVRLVRSSEGMTVVNDVSLDDYLTSVVGKEMYTTWPQEALKAQAVASRSYALFQKNRPKYKLFDVLSTTASQVYGGLNGEAQSTQAAVQATLGQVVTYQGNVIEAVFHSASGGHTENSENVWMSAVPYLRGVPDFDQSAPVFQWNQTLTAAQLSQRLPGLGTILAISPAQSSPTTGRLRMVKVQGDKGSRVMKAADVRSTLGLRSTLFSATPLFDLVAGQPGKTSSKPSGFQISGRGYGHGLGMSQWGAYGMAQQGKTYRDILTHYYQNTQVQTVYNQ